MIDNRRENKVCVSRVLKYDTDEIIRALRGQFESLGLDRELFVNKKVTVKPNLVMKKSPDAAATTHPAVLSAVLALLAEYGAENVIIAESPGGVYSKTRLEGLYGATGIAQVAQTRGVTLNYDTTWKRMEFADGISVKSFNIITPVADADIIIDLCKLKGHALTKMSGGVKNLFGTVPGIEKFEMHSSHPDYEDFAQMICDLCLMLCEKKRVITVCDAITGMEGNGPTSGTPRDIGYLISSENPFALDLLCENLLGFDGTVSTVKASVGRGLCPGNVSELDIDGTYERVSDFAVSDAYRGGTVRWLTFFSRGRVGKLFMPHPYIIKDKCRGCGECVRSCPQKTISLTTREGKSAASIDHGKCIRCFCCQELCPFGAIKIRRNPILQTISRIK